MSKAKHTPGPWEVNYRRVSPVNGIKDGKIDICHVYGDEWVEIANARLIAAAPDLLAAAKQAAESIDHFATTDGPSGYAYRILREAIRKAEGEGA
jgi:hypothetical protein